MNRFAKRVLILTVFVLCLFGLTVLAASAASADGYADDAAAIADGKVVRVGGTAESNEGATYYATLDEAVVTVSESNNVVWLVTDYTQAVKLPAWSKVPTSYTLTSTDPESITLTSTCANVFDMGAATKSLTLTNITVQTNVAFNWCNGHTVNMGEGFTLNYTGSDVPFTVKGNCVINVTDGAVINAPNAIAVFRVDNHTATVNISGATVTAPALFAGVGTLTQSVTESTISGKTYAAGAAHFAFPAGTFASDAEAIAMGAVLRIGAEGAEAKYYTGLKVATDNVSAGDVIYVLADMRHDYSWDSLYGKTTFTIEGVKSGEKYPTITEMGAKYLLATTTSGNVTLKNLNIITNGSTFQIDKDGTNLNLVNTQVRYTTAGTAFIVTMWGGSNFSVDKDSSIIIDAVTMNDMDIFYANTSWKGTVTVSGKLEVNVMSSSGWASVIQSQSATNTKNAMFILLDGANITMTTTGNAVPFRYDGVIIAEATNLGDIVITCKSAVRRSPNANNATTFANVVFNTTGYVLQDDSPTALTVKNCAFTTPDVAASARMKARVGAETVEIDGVTYYAGFYDDAAQALAAATAEGVVIKVVDGSLINYVVYDTFTEALANVTAEKAIINKGADTESTAYEFVLDGVTYTVLSADEFNLEDVMTVAAKFNGAYYTDADAAAAAAAAAGATVKVVKGSMTTFTTSLADAVANATAGAVIYDTDANNESTATEIKLNGNTFTVYAAEEVAVEDIVTVAGSYNGMSYTDLADADAAAKADGKSYRVNGAYYNNVADAFAAANTGDSIYSLNGQEASTTITIGEKSVTLYAADLSDLDAVYVEFGAVARVGEVAGEGYYETLVEALAAANGKTVYLLVNVDLGNTAPVLDGTTVTITSSGTTKTITMDGTAGFTLQNGAILTLENVNVTTAGKFVTFAAGTSSLNLGNGANVTAVMTAADTLISMAANGSISISNGATLTVAAGSTEDFTVINIAEGATLGYSQAGAVSVTTTTAATLIKDNSGLAAGSSTYGLATGATISFTAGEGTTSKVFDTVDAISVIGVTLEVTNAEEGNVKKGYTNDEEALAAGMKFRIGALSENPAYYETWADAVAALAALEPGSYTIYVLADFSGTASTINLTTAGWNISVVGVGETAPKLTFTNATNPFAMNASNISITLENLEITVATHLVISDGNNATNAKFTVKSGTTIKTAATMTARLFHLYDPCDVTIEAGAKIDTSATTFSTDFWVFDLSNVWNGTLTMDGEIVAGGTSNNKQFRVFSSTGGFKGKIVLNDTAKITLCPTGHAHDGNSVSGMFVAYGNIEIKGGTYKIASGVSANLVLTNGLNDSTIKITGNTVMIHEGTGMILRRGGGGVCIVVDSTSAQLIAKGNATIFDSPYYISVKGAYLSCEAASPFAREDVYACLSNVKFPTAEMAAKFGTLVLMLDAGATEQITVEGQAVTAVTGYFIRNASAKHGDVLSDAIAAVAGDSAQHVITLYADVKASAAGTLIGTAAGSHKLLIQSAEGQTYTITDAVAGMWLNVKTGAQLTFKNVNIVSNGCFIQIDASSTDTAVTLDTGVQLKLDGTLENSNYKTYAFLLWGKATVNLKDGASIIVPATANISSELYVFNAQSSFTGSINLAGNVTVSATAAGANRVQRIVMVNSTTGTVNITGGNYAINGGMSTGSSAIVFTSANTNISGGTLTMNGLGSILRLQSGDNTVIKVTGNTHIEHTGIEGSTSTDAWVYYRSGGNAKGLLVDGANVKLIARNNVWLIEQGYGVDAIKGATIHSDREQLAQSEGQHFNFVGVKFLSDDQATRHYTINTIDASKGTSLSTLYFVKVADVYYNLSGVYTVVPSGSTIELIYDIEQPHNFIPSGKSFTIDGNSFTMTAITGGGANMFLLQGGSTLTFKDITVVAALGYIGRVYADSHLILEEGAHLINYAVDGSDRGLQLDGSAKLTIKQGASLGIPAENQTKMTGGFPVVNVTSDWSGTLDVAGRIYAAHTTNDWTFPIRVRDNCTGTVILRSTASLEQLAGPTGHTSNGALHFGNNAAGTLLIVEEGATLTSTTSVLVGLYSNPSFGSDFAAALCGKLLRVGNETTTVNGYTIYTAESYYSDFAAAAAAAGDNGTVYVIGDSNIGSNQFIIDGTTITFEGIGQNQPTISMTGSTYHFLLRNGAHVTFKNVSLYTTGRFSQFQGKETTNTLHLIGTTALYGPMVQGDTRISMGEGARGDILIGPDASLGIEGTSAGNAHIIYLNTASSINLVIEGAFYNTSDKAGSQEGMFTGVYDPASVNSTIIVKKTATVYQGSQRPNADSSMFRTSSTVVVEGGEFYSLNAPIFAPLNNGTVNIKGGFFYTTGKNTVGVFSAQAASTLNIYGGYFEGSGVSTIMASKGATVNIYGGAFNYTGEKGTVAATGYGDTAGVLNVYGGTFRSISTEAPVFAALYNDGNSISLRCFVASGYANLITNIASGYRTGDHLDALLGRSTLNGFTVTGGADPVFINTTPDGTPTYQMAMQFKATLSEAAKNHVLSLIDEDTGITLGMIAIPTEDYLMAASMYGENFPIHAMLEGADYDRHIDQIATGTNITEEDDGCMTIRMTLSNVDPNTAYSVFFYAKYTVDGNTVYNYSDYVSSRNSRSMVQVARAALNDLSDTQNDVYQHAVGDKFSPYSEEYRNVMLGVCGGDASLLPLDIYVIAGGTNAAGNTRYPIDSAMLAPNPYVFSSGFATTVSEQIFSGRKFSFNARKYLPAGTMADFGQGLTDSLIGPEVGMAQMLSERYNQTSGQYAAILKYATVDLSMNDIDEYYDLLVEAIEFEISAYRIMGYDASIVGMYWMQGEADYANNSVTNYYAEDFQTMVEDLREDLAATITEIYGKTADLSVMPVVVGQIGLSYVKDDLTAELAFAAMQSALADIDGLEGIYCIDSSELTSKDDVFTDWHDVLLNGEIVAATLFNNGTDGTDVEIPEIPVKALITVPGVDEPIEMKSILKAIYAAPEGATITLLADLDVFDTLEFSGLKNITLGGNGTFGISSSVDNDALLLSNSTVTLNNFVIRHTGDDAVNYAAIRLGDNVNLALTGDSALTTQGTGIVVDGKNSKLTVDGATLDTTGDAIHAFNGNVTIEDATITSATGACVVIDFDAAYRLAVVVKAGTYNAATAFVNNSVHAVLVVSDNATVNGGIYNVGFGSGNPEYDFAA